MCEKTVVNANSHCLLVPRKIADWQAVHAKVFDQKTHEPL
jgi:hypothetical protein